MRVSFCVPGIAPNITAGPTDSAVIDSMSVILHCETSGAPRPAITWQKGVWTNSTPFLMEPHSATFALSKSDKNSEMDFILYFGSLLFAFPDISLSLFPLVHRTSSFPSTFHCRWACVGQWVSPAAQVYPAGVRQLASKSLPPFWCWYLHLHGQ